MTGTDLELYKHSGLGGLHVRGYKVWRPSRDKHHVAYDLRQDPKLPCVVNPDRYFQEQTGHISWVYYLNTVVIRIAPSPGGQYKQPPKHNSGKTTL